ncbi:MAG: cytochrome C assembly family protein [Halothiobacillaceae bacterium]
MTLIALLTIALYLAATGLIIQRVRDGRDAGSVDRTRSLALGLAALALIGHGLLLYDCLHCDTAAGLDLRVLNALSLVMWLTAILIMGSALRHPVENLGIAVLPLAALASALGFFTRGEAVIRTPDPGVDAHILLSLLAYSLLTLAALQAVTLAWQHKALHSHQPRGIVRLLPPMESVEHLMFAFITVGFALLTAGLLTGLLFLDNLFAQHLVHKTVLSIIAWLIFAGLLIGRQVAGWRGRTAVHWTLAGFGTLLLAYFGSKIVLEWVLGIR